jgi:hypothetical protein
VSATTGQGVGELTELLLKNPVRTARDAPARLRFEARALRRLAWENSVAAELEAVDDLASFVTAASRV